MYTTCLPDLVASDTRIISLSLHSRYLLASFYTFYDVRHTVVNFIALLIGVVPKLPQLHKFRLFGINKY